MCVSSLSALCPFHFPHGTLRGKVGRLRESKMPLQGVSLTGAFQTSQTFLTAALNS